MIKKRESFRILSCQIAGTKQLTVPLSGVIMALTKDFFAMHSCGFCHIPTANHKFQHEAKQLFDTTGGFKLNMGSGLVLKGHINISDGTTRNEDEGFKPRAVAPDKHLLRDFLVGVKDINGKLINGRSNYDNGSHVGFPNQPMLEKLVVAVDVDEVLGSFLSALNKFIADHYSSNHSVSEYHVYEFFKIWNCSRREADIRVHEFFKTPYFTKGIFPIPGAQQALLRLSRYCTLSVVTSRQNVIKDHTIEWLERHYSGLFQEIHFGNHFALDGTSRSKSEICRSMGARVLIDDNPRYAVECAEAGIKVLLFDYHNSYPWCKTGSADLHPLVSKVHNWQEVEQQLLSWVVA